MGKILDEFFSDLYCPICKTITEHNIQKIDEGGYKEIDFDSVSGIFVSEKEIVITGFPKSDDETHNCDYMGCSSISHVIFRADITNIR